jgi:prepilin-type N-terminal cleavage/methylation domain-containing protein
MENANRKLGLNSRYDFQPMNTNLNFENNRNFAEETKRNCGQEGFSLIEVSIAMVVFLIAVLGVFISFAYAVSYNSGNSSRAQALALLQQKVEQMRSARFVPTFTDDALKGGTKTPEVVTGPDGNPYRLDVVVDDDPFTADVQIDDTKLFKEVSVTVRLEAPTPGWQSSVPATIILRRVRGN